jgi:hypothetical protein
LIKRIGEEHGYRATVELPVLDGVGSVDVALKNDSRAIACEISVTTGVDHEMSNLQKCLAAGFAYVLLVSPDPRHVAQLNRAPAVAVPAAELDRVRVLTAEGVICFLDELAAGDGTREERVGGFKVKTKFRAVPPDEQASRTGAISRTIGESLKRLKGK